MPSFKHASLIVSLIFVLSGLISPLNGQSSEAYSISTIAGGSDVPGSLADGLPATSASVFVEDLMLDGRGDLYLWTYPFRLRRVTANGVMETVAGYGEAGFSGDGGPALSAGLSYSFGVAIDAAGNILLADTNNNRIRKVIPGGVIMTIAGSGPAGFQGSYGGDGGLATLALLNRPNDVALDTAGNLYIADTENLRIRKVTVDGVITTLAGTGVRGFSGDGGQATAATFNDPVSLAVDSSGNVYVSDSRNHRIRKITPAGSITTVAGSGRVDVPMLEGGGFGGDGGPADLAQLKHPRGIAIDGQGNLYIADKGNNRLRKATGTTNLISTIAGDGTAGFSGDGGPAVAAQLVPTGVAVDSRGIVYVADSFSQVWIGAHVRRLVPQSFNPPPGQSLQIVNTPELPPGRAAKPYTTFLVSDGGIPFTYKWRLVSGAIPEGLVLNPDAGVLSGTPQRSGVFTFTLDVTDSAQTRGSKTFTLLIEEAVPANSALTITTPQVLPRARVGELYSFALSATGVPAPYRWSTVVGGGIFVNGLWLNPSTGVLSGVPGSSYVATFTVRCSYNDQFFSDKLFTLVIDPVQPPGPEVEITTPATLPEGAVGWPYSATLSTNANSLPYAKWSVSQGALPDGLRLDGATGTISGTPQRGGTFRLTARAIDVSGIEGAKEFTLVINAQFPPETLLIRTIAGNPSVDRSSGFPSVVTDYNGDGTASMSTLNQPSDVAVDREGNLYIADTSNHRVRKILPSGIIMTLAGSATFPAGSGGFSGDGGPATEAKLDRPGGIALDSAGNVYIADTLNNRIRKVSPSGTITTVAGRGRPRLPLNDGGPAIDAPLQQPAALAFDSGGNLFIADRFNHRIRRISPDGIITTVAGSGPIFDPDCSPRSCPSGGAYSGDGGPATEARLNFPSGVALDAQGNLYIADSGNSRIRKVVAITGVISTVAGTGVSGFNGDGGPAVDAQLSSPSRLAFDSAGNLYVTDIRVRKISPGGLITTVAGDGMDSYSGEWVPAISAQLGGPIGIAVGANSIFVADSGSHRIRELFQAGQASPRQPTYRWLLPSSAHAPGLGGAFYTTSLTVSNTGATQADLTLKFLGSQLDGRNGPERSVSLEPGATRTFTDVLGSLFGISEDYGAIQISANVETLAVTSQTTTPGIAGGTFGQSVPAFSWRDLVVNGKPRTIVGVREDNRFRTNLVLANATDEPLEVSVSLIAGNGSILGSKAVALPPMGMVQINRVVRELGGTDDAGPTRLQLVTTTPGGYFAAYAAQIDNVTNDPRTLLPVEITSYFQALLLLPSSARVGGFNGAFFTTGLTLFNPADQPMPLQLKFLGNNRNGSLGEERNVTLDAGQSLSYDDVLESVFGLGEGFGAIQITASYVPGYFLPVVQSTTSTPDGTGGSYGQSVPAIPKVESIFLGAERSIVGIREDEAFRSNLVLANLSVAQVDADITLVNEAGIALGSRRISLQPQGMTQLNRVVRELGVDGDVSEARLLLSTPTFGGAFVPYVALIDNTTNDPRTLLPQ